MIYKLNLKSLILKVKKLTTRNIIDFFPETEYKKFDKHLS